MNKIIHKIDVRKPMIKKKVKVAAYARVSMDTDRLRHSLSAQISYYNNLIQNNPDWEFVEVYADLGISGISTKNRQEFIRMIKDAENGKIDIILTKSIQRFARNTVDLLNTVRHLKEIGVEVRFEKENINSLSGDGELMLSIMASFAQEESRSISNNVKWRIRKQHEKGIPNNRTKLYGYRWEGDKIVIVEEEAKIVRLIYENYLNGISAEKTEKQLAEMGILSSTGKRFPAITIRQMLKNINYTGNLLLQKEYVVDPITKKTKKNKGELPMYLVENNHEAIIPKEIFDKVQEKIALKKKLGVFGNDAINTYPFTSKIECNHCNCNFRRKTTICFSKKNYRWLCRRADEKGRKVCDSRSLPEEKLEERIAEVLGLKKFDNEIFQEKIEKIIVVNDDEINIKFYDGKLVKTKLNLGPKKNWERGRSEKYSLYAKEGIPISDFTNFIKCGYCGKYFSRNTSHYGEKTWICREQFLKCKKTGSKRKSVPEIILKESICEVLGLKRFNKEIMRENIDCIIVKGNEVTFKFKNGGFVKKELVISRRKCRKYTEEERKECSRRMIEVWKNKKEKNDAKESNNNTCDDKEV